MLKNWKQRGNQHHKIDRKKDSKFCKKVLRQIYIQFPHYSEKKLLLLNIQIIITTMSDESSHLLSVSISFILVLSSAYHPSLMIHALSSVSLFKISLISTFNQSLHLLWDAVNCCPCVSVEEQNSSADQIRNTWHISNEFQLQLYIQWESQQFL